MNSLRRLLFLAALAFAGACAAGGATVTHDFLAPAAVDFHVLLTPPPAADSIAARSEQELMRHLQAVRTPEQTDLAKYYEPLDVFRMLAPVLGAWCTAENLPRTAALFQQVRSEARPTINETKAAWSRPRPYIFDGTLQPAVERPNNTSYPSGHSTESAMYAVILSAALPEHAADWQHQAMLVRWSRIIGGAHYPSDTIAGQILGEALGRAMLQSPKLRQALEEIRAEITSHQEKKAA